MKELHLLHEQLTAWDSDLVDCICLVGYTANVYEKDKEKNLSLNIQWVVVLANLAE